MPAGSYLSGILEKHLLITPIDGGARFPEVLLASGEKYISAVNHFITLVMSSTSSDELLARIRSRDNSPEERMSLLKIFRRCVSTVVDTEMAKKVKIPTEQLVASYGCTFKDIKILKEQFNEMADDHKMALCALISEYDTRGQLGYALTEQFFNWFREEFTEKLTIEGPIGAGRDIELSSIFPDYNLGKYPCDFVIRNIVDKKPLAVGFARYDSTRGGAQSDDRTSGNQNKVEKAKQYFDAGGTRFKIIFLADGPGLLHKDTWEEACQLDDSLAGDVRVMTLKLAPERLDPEWLFNQ